MPEQLPHIYLKGPNSTIPYTAVSSGGGQDVPIIRDRKLHGEYISYHTDGKVFLHWDYKEGKILN